MESLPGELVLYISEFLPYVNKVALYAVCKHFAAHVRLDAKKLMWSKLRELYPRESVEIIRDMFPRYVIAGGFMFRTVHGLPLNGCDIDFVETIAGLMSPYEAEHVDYYNDIKVARLNIAGRKTEIIKFGECCPVFDFDFDFCKIVFDGERIKFCNFESALSKACNVEVSKRDIVDMYQRRELDACKFSRLRIRINKYIGLGCKFKITVKELYG